MWDLLTQNRKRYWIANGVEGGLGFAGSGCETLKVLWVILFVGLSWRCSVTRTCCDYENTQVRLMCMFSLLKLCVHTQCICINEDKATNSICVKREVANIQATRNIYMYINSFQYWDGISIKFSLRFVHTPGNFTGS